MGLVADVFEMLVIDGDGDVIAHDTLQESNISVETETSDVTGGRNDALLAILHGRREIEITGNTPKFNLQTLAKHIGNDIKTGAGVAYAMPKWFTVQVGEKIELENTPMGESGLVIKDKDGQTIPNTNILLSGKEVSFSSGVTEGDEVQVVTYRYETTAETQTLEIDADKFPKDVKIILQTLEINEDEQTMAYLQFEYPRVKPSSNFAFNTTAAREASVQEMSFRVLKPKTSSKIGAIKRIPVTE